MTFVLCILDGWGCTVSPKNDISSSESKLLKQYDAIKNAHTPYYDKLITTCPHSLLKASGVSVGLPEDQMGNSEVGHITIGAGRIVMQDLLKINHAISSSAYTKNREINSIISYLKDFGKTCHLLGIASDGGVHGHINHLLANYRLLVKNGINVVVHAFTDGRDVAPRSAEQYLKKLEESDVRVASISGRYFAMDRDKRYERTLQAYNAIALAKANRFDNYQDLINSQYKDGITDEFIEPQVANFYRGIEKGDALLFLNYRADRMRQLCESLIDPNFKVFPVSHPTAIKTLCMTKYSDKIANLSQVIFPPENIQGTLSEVLSKNGKTQLKLAETEKYAHVTYFLNGGIEEPFKGEEHLMVPSPKVATYDLAPAMSCNALCDLLINAILSDKYDFIGVNFANADMVGHTGNYNATVEAINALDVCLGRIIEAVKSSGSEALFTADHGNAEQMVDPTTHQPLTSHTFNKVPFIYLGEKKISLEDGELCDIAPTILKLLNIAIPSNMTGKILFR